MQTWSFELALSGFDRDVEEAVDALFAAGCDDATLLERGPTPVLQFDREATSLEEALTSAIQDVERADVGATVLRVEPDDLVNASDIARRTGRSREAARLWIGDECSQNPFPPPMALLEKSALWSWLEVSSWLRRRNVVELHVVGQARVIAAMNRFLEEQRTVALHHDVSQFASSLGTSAMVARLRELRDVGDKEAG